MSGRDDETGDVQWVVARPFPRWKRLLDIAVVAVAIVVSAPVIAAAGALIKLASPGPVFFGQERVGRLGRRFTCWKLRTMRVNADDDAHRRHVNALIRSAEGMAKLDANRDPRVFLVGRFLRAWCVDELPQLYNVLRGDMSLIGPRPCIPYEYEQYQDWHRQRCEAMPGLTGLWQVSGKNRLSFSQMVRMDIAYARGLTPALDVKILLRTLPAIWAQARDLAHIADPTRHRPAVAARSV
jgi:lipopolysaccharide/colanic/teichoic acid biosynthesis glycosyltransferase